MGTVPLQSCTPKNKHPQRGQSLLAPLNKHPQRGQSLFAPLGTVPVGKPRMGTVPLDKRLLAETVLTHRLPKTENVSEWLL